MVLRGRQGHIWAFHCHAAQGLNFLEESGYRTISLHRRSAATFMEAFSRLALEYSLSLAILVKRQRAPLPLQADRRCLHHMERMSREVHQQSRSLGDFVQGRIHGFATLLHNLKTTSKHH